MIIDKFDGEYAFLSNFYPATIVIGKVTYPTAEHAFQAMKTSSTEERIRISKLTSPGQAKREGRKLKLRDDWESVKINVMANIVYAKFNDNPDLREKLLATGNFKLVEGNNWGDTFWGSVNGKGKNLLGKILMHIRSVLR